MSEYLTELANDIAYCCPDLVDNGCGKDNCVSCLAFKLIGMGWDKIRDNPNEEAKRQGEWIKQTPDPEVMKAFHEMGLGGGMSINSIYWTCSLCGNWGTPHHKYCSSCGAKMSMERTKE